MNKGGNYKVLRIIKGGNLPCVKQRGKSLQVPLTREVIFQIKKITAKIGINKEASYKVL